MKQHCQMDRSAEGANGCSGPAASAIFHPRRNTKRRFLKRLAFGVVVGSGLTAAVFASAIRWWPYPAGADRLPDQATFISGRHGEPLAAFASDHGGWFLAVSGQDISPHLMDAIVGVEDQRFFEHGGVDWRSVLGAGLQDLKSLGLHRGASTLTMQLEHLREPATRSIPVKLAQAIRACQIERTLSKQQILVEYLNRAPFGGNLVGVGAASRRYFGRKCGDLSLGQAALLAGLPQSPNRLRPDRHPDDARVRRDHVLGRMLSLGMISAGQFREAANEPVNAAWHPLPQDAQDTGSLPALAGLARQFPGQTLRTTFDLEVQKAASAAMTRQLATLAGSHVTAGAVVVLDTPTGECLAAVSRTCAGDEAVDLTVRPRSSGSTLKPLIYAAAFDAGVCTPRTILDDSPASWAGYEPSNYDRQFDGPLPAGEALSLSRNVPALFVLSKVGVGRAVEVMRGTGLATLARAPDRYGLSLAIGGAEVTPMELAEAYATLARGGRDIPVSVVQWLNSQQAHAADRRGGKHAGGVLRGPSCLAVLRCLGDVERTRRVCPSATGLAPAWKTGTSSGHRDAWCAAVTPRRTVVVWLGNTDGSGSDALVGQDAAAPVALQILAAVDLPGRATGGFAPPPGFLAVAKTGVKKTSSDELAMVSPVDHQQIFYDPGLPGNQQRFALRARAASTDAGELWWFVDGGCVGSCSSEDRLWWDPVAGSHDIRVVDAEGRASSATVLVR